MPTLNQMLSGAAADCGVVWCSPAAAGAQRPATDIYTRPTRSEFWLYVLSITNPAKARSLVAEMVAMLRDALPTPPPVNPGNPDAYLEWHTSNRGLARTTAHKAFVYGNSFRAGTAGPMHGARLRLRVFYFGWLWSRAMLELQKRDAASFEQDHCEWLQDHATYAEFVNGAT